MSIEGRLICFEGLDGSGKETQTKLLEKRLREHGVKVLRVEFPNYSNKYSVFAKEYLSGKFDEKFINPYIVSTFFSLDRFGEYHDCIRDYLNEGYIIICDRYVYSNLIYQGSRIKNYKERLEFFDWVLNFEYNICNLPKADIVFFLDCSIETSLKIVKSRFEGNSNTDIHEKDEEFLRKCYENCKYVAEKYNLFSVKCDFDGKLLPIEKINDIIYKHILKKFNFGV